MKHRIVVLGAGYAGAFSAGYLARRLHRDDVEITVVNAEPDFVERLRLHQLATGRDLRHRPLTEVFAGTGIAVRVARVTAVDVEHHTIALADGATLTYDTLLYALGSTVADHDVPGVAEHAFHVASRPAALRLRARLDALGETDEVVVVGGNLTAIETATEIAETHPELHVSLATRGETGAWLGTEARRHLRTAFDRFGITVHEHTPIDRVEPTAARSTDGRVFTADAVVWAAGFAASPLAATSGLTVAADGRISVDRHLRSVSHPRVFVAGDSASVLGDNGRVLPMSCASAGFTGAQAVASIIADLTGRAVKTSALSYLGNHISLGRADAIFQLVDKQGHPRPGALRGWPAARVKSAIVATSGWAVSRPTFAKPPRRYRVRALEQSALAG
ncbi:NAD(P)/FAD-dependent oxidoreductase [Nocardia lasii]|uniref:NAD(P)/FAD-dependent oxidoreductase n=1 Tax=Nocardia lasii TaxID=1616107 RepID=A0ABW1JNT8_9NOCA